MFRLLRWIITTLTALCLLYLITMNPQTITLSWYPGADPLELPIAALIIILFAVGYIIGTLYYAFTLWPKQLKTAKKIRAQDKRIKQLEKELETKNDTTTNLLRD